MPELESADLPRIARWTFPEYAAMSLLFCVLLQIFGNATYSIGALDQSHGGLGPLFSMKTVDVIAASLAWLPQQALALSAVFVFGALGLGYWQWLTVEQDDGLDAPLADDHMKRVQGISWTSLVLSILGVLGAIAAIAAIAKSKSFPLDWTYVAALYATQVIGLILAALAAWAALLLIRRTASTMHTMAPPKTPPTDQTTYG